jgi:glycosyltransferase involved in cell wall biosynthesis
MVVEEQSELLAEAGHEVRIFRRDSDDHIGGKTYPLRSAVTTLTGFGPSPLKEIEDFKPDIVHIHNLFPNFGTNWLQDLQVPFVSTLHNYRPLCANGLLFRDGAVCMDCPSGRPMSAVKHRCFHESRFATMPLAMRNARGLERNPVFNRSAALIFLNHHAAGQFKRFGAPPNRIHVIPNGLRVAQPASTESLQEKWFTAGRLDEAKGIAQLVACWPESEMIDVAGEGPERSRIEEMRHPGVHLLGDLARHALIAKLATYKGVLIPALSPEMQPTIAIEAIALGVPVIARRGNAAADLVEATGIGATYSTKAELCQALEQVALYRTRYSQQAQMIFKENFTPEVWLGRILTLYQACIDEGPRTAA